MSHGNRKPPSLAQIEKDEAKRIAEILRPLTVFDKSTKALPVLQMLAKYETLAGSQLSKIFRDPNVVAVRHNPMKDLLGEGYVTVKKGLLWRGVSNIFTITAKGRTTLKGKT